MGKIGKIGGPLIPAMLVLWLAPVMLPAGSGHAQQTASDLNLPTVSGPVAAPAPEDCIPTEILRPRNCGNGSIDRREQCDDGNEIDDDSCSNRCKRVSTDPSFCGNGRRDRGEECDDGNSVNDDTCSNSCIKVSVEKDSCGNGNRDRGEECDDGNTINNDACSNSCQSNPVAAVAVCGNGTIDQGEQCDDGNRSNRDGCSATCLVEVAFCGNNQTERENGEQCDDGGRMDGDGCTANCLREPDVCGNGVPEPGESCDDGNRNNDDACANDCTVRVYGPICGNGVIEPDELCDDGNRNNNDACRNDCTKPPQALVPPTPPTPQAVCGNDVVETNEQCDDGNRNDNDACRNDCTKPPQALVPPTPPTPQAVCGNGVVETNEQCDDGNRNDNDACRNDCTKPPQALVPPTPPTPQAVCGNGVVETNEQCDDGNRNDNDACRNDCTKPPLALVPLTPLTVQAVCGNGVIEAGEQCDDGNRLNGDGCSEKCREGGPGFWGWILWLIGLIVLIALTLGLWWLWSIRSGRGKVVHSTGLAGLFVGQICARGLPALKTFQQQLGPINNANADQARDLFLAYRSWRAWSEMFELHDAMPENLKSELKIRQQYAFALNRAGRDTEAEQILKNLRHQYGPSAETCGIVGRVYKDRWERLWRDGGEIESEHLDLAIQSYLEGHDADPGNPYPGINVLTLIGFSPVWHVELYDRLIVEVSDAVETRVNSNEYWDQATRLELAIHLDREEEARAALPRLEEARNPAISSCPERWKLETTTRNLRLIESARQIREKYSAGWVTEVIAALGVENH